MHEIAINNLKYEGLETETILEAGLSNDVYIARSCKSGRCNSCRCKVLSGETKLISPELGLNDEEREEGWILSCVRSPLSSLKISCDDVLDRAVPEVKLCPARIDSLQLLTKDVLQVTLRLPPSSKLDFYPGQYIDVLAFGLSRSYSIANAPRVDSKITLIIKRVPDGRFSEYWFDQAKENDLLRIKGPYGTFFLRETQTNKLVFFATGTGIAPIKAMLEARLLDNDSPMGDVKVLWGNRYRDDFFELGFSNMSGINLIKCVSREDADPAFKSGYIQDVFLADDKHMLSDTALYACGSSEMIAASEQKMRAMGHPAKQFFKDAFVASGGGEEL